VARKFTASAWCSKDTDEAAMLQAGLQPQKQCQCPELTGTFKAPANLQVIPEPCQPGICHWQAAQQLQCLPQLLFEASMVTL
jgi:hypothetical protein